MQKRSVVYPRRPPPVHTSLVSRLLPGAVPGASKPSKLLLQYSVWLLLRVDGHGGSGGRRMQVQCRGGSPGAQSPRPLAGSFVNPALTWLSPPRRAPSSAGLDQGKEGGGSEWASLRVRGRDKQSYRARARVRASGRLGLGLGSGRKLTQELLSVSVGHAQWHQERPLLLAELMVGAANRPLGTRRGDRLGRRCPLTWRLLGWCARWR